VLRNAHEVDSLLQELSAHGFGGVQPTEAQLRALIQADRDGPLHFLNLLSYHDAARYPQDHESAGAGLTGQQAYERYGMVALDHATRRGGQLTMYNDVCQVVIGVEEGWDQVAVMAYPDTEAFLDMVRDPDYQGALVHRDAGLARTLVVATRPLLPTG
jgi:uncharacterized protein (DUF1330 family)